MIAYDIAQLDSPGAEREWQEYVAHAPNASRYHALEWRDILLSSFGHPPHYLMARADGVVRGVLPLIRMKSALFGHFLVSLPFVDYGGILADDAQAEAALASAAVELAVGTGARHIELRHSSPACPGHGWNLRQHKAALVIPLRSDPERHWMALSSRLRGKVRKAEKSGAVFSITGVAELDDFYRVFALNMRDLGTPVYSREFFRNILRQEANVSILSVRRGERMVAGAIALRRGEKIELPWICSDYSEASFYVNEYLYWNAIRWASQQGARDLDLGRCSVESGTYRFKMQWNPQVRPLLWYYWLASGTDMPELNPDNPRYSLAIRCWKKMPLLMANQVGPWIVRNIP